MVKWPAARPPVRRYELSLALRQRKAALPGKTYPAESTAQPEAHAFWKARLVHLYSIVDPQEAWDVDRLLQKYKGHEEQVYHEALAKYDMIEVSWQCAHGYKLVPSPDSTMGSAVAVAAATGPAMLSELASGADGTAAPAVAVAAAAGPAPSSAGSSNWAMTGPAAQAPSRDRTSADCGNRRKNQTSLKAREKRRIRRQGLRTA